MQIEGEVDRSCVVELRQKRKKEKKVQILKNTDTCHNSKHTLHRTQLLYIIIYIVLWGEKKTKK